MRLATLSLFAATTAFAAPADGLRSYLGSHRIVVASAPRADDPALARQRALFVAMGRQARLRDLVFVEAVGDGAEASSLRKRLSLDGHAFTVVLIGKDGGAKLRASHPLDAAALFPVIDAMPMRREEMRDRGE